MSRTVRVALFGASERGRQCLDEFSRWPDVEVVRFLDNAPAKWGTSWLGQPVERPTPAHCADVEAIVVSTVHVGEVFVQLRRLGAASKVALSPADLSRRFLPGPEVVGPLATEIDPPGPEVRALAAALGRRSSARAPGGSARATCTICCNNYLAFATVLAHSYLAHHPDDRFFICLADRRLAGVAYPDDPRITVLEAGAIGIAGFEAIAFRYTTIEFTTAIKPFLLRHLLDTYPIDALTYLDPDILVCAALETLHAALDHASLALVPHILSPLDDDLSPSEVDILRAGTFNLGVIALSRSPETDRFLAWWGRRLRLYCTTEVEKGLFTDQKWIDLVPSLFPSHAIVRDHGLDVAYWNLHERTVGLEGSRATVGAGPLRFFHFSGIDVHDLDAVSRHQNRHRLGAQGPLRLLFEAYRALVVEAGHTALSAIPPHYASFDDGTPIPAMARQIYRRPEVAMCFPEPFVTTGPDAYVCWLQEPAGVGSEVTRLFAGIHAMSPDLQRAFPDPLGNDALGLVAYIAAAADLYGLAPCFLDATAHGRTDGRS